MFEVIAPDRKISVGEINVSIFICLLRNGKLYLRTGVSKGKS